MKIGTAAVATQLAEMETGLRDKFDAKAIETQVLAYIVSAKINENVDSALSDSPQLADAAKSAAVPVTNTVLDSVITQTPIDVKAMAIIVPSPIVNPMLDTALNLSFGGR